MDALSVLILWLLFGGKMRRGGDSAREWPKPKPTFPGGGDYPPPTKHTTTDEKPADKPKLQPLPGGGWKPYSPPPSSVVARAWALMPKLPMGGWVTETDPTGLLREVAYRKEPHKGGKTGVTVYFRPATGD